MCVDVEVILTGFPITGRFRGAGPWSPNVRRIFFCSVKNRFHDKFVDSSGCDNAKRRSALAGL